MQNGERQVSPTLEGIRADHVARYRWAAYYLGNGQTVLDIGCGIGYGSKILSDADHMVNAYDKDREALDYGAKHYPHDSIQRYLADLRSCTGFEGADAAVAFEIVEHLENPKPLLHSLAEKTPLLLTSVPNEKVFPFQNHAFHHRHYTSDQFERLLCESGWSVVEWFGQVDHESEVEANVEGRTLIAVCESRLVEKSEPKNINVPDHVAIVGLGPSATEYFNIAKALGDRHKLCDEVWGINAIGGVLQCDLVFHMDDVRIQEIRSEATPESNIAAMLEWMKVTTTPIVTSRLHPNYPTLVEFPLESVINDLKFDYFNNTAAYAVAYAIHIGVKKITLFGCDYTYPNAHDAEKGRGCLEFWLGIAAGRGITIGLNKATTLMDAINDRQDRLYGYDTRRVDFIHNENGTLQVAFEEITDLPTAAEIEAAYDHGKHPNALMEEES